MFQGASANGRTPKQILGSHATLQVQQVNLEVPELESEVEDEAGFEGAGNGGTGQNKAGEIPQVSEPRFPFTRATHFGVTLFLTHRMGLSCLRVGFECGLLMNKEGLPPPHPTKFRDLVEKTGEKLRGLDWAFPSLVLA